MTPANPAARRHTILFAAAVFLLIAGFLDPGALHRLACHVGIMTVAFMVVCAFLAAKGIGKLADVFFRGSVRPWYCRPGIVVFLCATLPLMNVLFIVFDNIFIGIRDMGQVTTQQVRMVIFMGLELLWIASLE